MTVTDEQKKHVEKLILQGSHIEAVKYLRDTYGLDLKTAKRLADEIKDNLTEDDQLARQPTGRAQQKGGCFLWIFVVIGGLLLGAAIWVAIYNYQRKLEGQLVVGRVVEFPSQPKIEYSYEGKTYYYYSSTSSEPPSYELGEEVDLYIDPDYPENVMVDTFTESYLVSTILGGIGTPFLLVGLFMIRLFNRQQT